MNDSILIIPLANLALAFIPVLAVAGILFLWSLDYRNALYAALRMLIQLLIIGYFLLFIFESDSVWLVIGVVAVMVSAGSWIALGSIAERRRALYIKALLSIALGGGFVLVLITQGVLDLAPWYSPRYLIPIAGMIFANAMNTVSLAAERFYSETRSRATYKQARDTAFRASLIPNVNTLFAVGLVSIPGMMTGQILAGVSPLIATRYQIMVMCMLFGTSGLASACFLILLRLRVHGLQGEEGTPLVT